MTIEKKQALVNKVFYYVGLKYDRHKANGNRRLASKCVFIMNYAEELLEEYEGSEDPEYFEDFTEDDGECLDYLSEDGNAPCDNIGYCIGAACKFYYKQCH